MNVLRAQDPARALVFCATREGAHHMASSLSERGFEVVRTSRYLSPNEARLIGGTIGALHAAAQLAVAEAATVAMRPGRAQA